MKLTEQRMLKQIRQPFLLLAAILLVGLVCAAANAQEDFDSAFESSALPWYDASSGELKQSDAPSRPGSVVSDRNRIPPFQSKKKGQPKPKPAAPAPAATTGAGTASTVGTSLVWIAAIVFAALLIGLLIYGFLKLESGDGDADGEDAKKRKRKIRDHIKHLPFEIEEHDGDFETFAEKALRNGDYSNAVIYLFADLLVAMNESGVVRLQRGKTNRQYLNEIWDHGEIRPYYRKVMTAFEDAFFGKHVIEKSRAEECFSDRPAFDAAIEKIRQMKFAASQDSPVIAPTVTMEGI